MEFLEKQLDIYDSYNITYVSRNMYVSFNEAKNKVEKIMDYPSTEEKEKGFETVKDLNKNSCFVPTGEDYNLIVVDVDVVGKNPKTEKKFNQFVEQNDVNIDTFTMKTINNGYHYYYKPTKAQKATLKAIGFGKSLKNFLGDLDIDILYNNNYVFGATTAKDKEGNKYKYKVLNNEKVAKLPEALFNEIIKTHKGKGKQTKPKPDLEVVDLEESGELSEADKRLSLYLDACKKVSDRNDWLTIGNAIYNEGGSFMLFNNYSKQFPKEYDYNGCVKVWKSYRKGKYALSTISSLVKIIEKFEPGMIQAIENKDTIGILDKIFKENIINDDIISRLFFSLYQTGFIYSPENDSWYSMNKYGIYDVEGKDNMTIKSILKTEIKILLEREIRNRRLAMKEHIEKIKKDGDDDKITQEMKKLAGFEKLCSNVISYMGKSVNKKSILSELAILYKRHKIYEEFDKVNPYVIAFLNGVYDLKNKTFRNAYPNELVSITTGYEYNPKTSLTLHKNKLMDMLCEIFPVEEERTYVLNTMSLTLVGLNTLEEFYIWIGTGSNGKGVLSNILSKTLGGYYDSMDVEYLVKSSSSRSGADPVMARKKGIRGVVTTELEKEVKLREGKLKELTGRDEIQVRELYKSPFNFVPVFKIFIQTNKKPEIDGTDMGLKRRLRLINFPSKFVDIPKNDNEYKIDRSLKDVFNDTNYLLAFFDILLSHYNKIEETNFSFPFPERFQKETDLFFKDNDPVDAFITDCCELSKDATTLLKDVHTAYIAYCAECGFESMKNKSLKEALTQKGYKSKRITDGFAFQGMKLKKQVD